MKAVAYCRLSPGDRKSAGRNGNADALGPEAQRQAIEAWARSQGVKIGSWHQDIDVSGGDEIADRPGLMAALESLRPGDVLVAAKGDRFARDTLIAAMLERLVDRAKATISTADGIGAGAGPEAQLMRSLVAAFAQYERALIRSRTKSALAVKRARGEMTGKAPYGTTVALRNGVKILIPDPREQAAVSRMEQLGSQGVSYHQICAVLTQEGHLPRAQRWHASTVRSILARAMTEAGLAVGP